MRTSRSSITLTLGTMAWCDTPSSALSQKCPDLPRRITGWFSGVGQSKLKRYGADVLKVVRAN
jgi:hypothetical protein